jgi:tetratricopeptide (TPR) repeat protein
MRIVFFCMLFYPLIIFAQTNCSVYNDKSHKDACELYNNAIQYSQGSRQSQQIFLESLKACPSFAPSLHEMSVPYLKRGDFYTWKLLIDKAVAADPAGYLGDRGWCLFKFLKDYQNSFNDLNRLYHLTHGQPGFSGDGDYDLLIIMALCKRELGDNKEAVVLFNKCISEHEKQQRIGLFDYLHRGVTHLAMKDYQAAIIDFKLEIRKYEKLADTYYYLGLTYLKLEQKTKALGYFNKSRTLFTKTGYYHSDPYCEVPDQVYLSDIECQINKLRTSEHHK